MSKCFYSVDGTSTLGPVSLEELNELHNSAQISDFSLYIEEIPNPDTWNNCPIWGPVITLTGRSNRKGVSNLPCPSQIDLVRQYSGAIIQANANHSSTFEAALIEFVGKDYFSLKVCSLGKAIHYPIRSILSLREWSNQVSYKIHRPIDRTIKKEKGAIAKFFSTDSEDKPPELMDVKVNTLLTLELYHNVIYKGSVGIGMGIPIGNIVGAVMPD